MNIHIISQPRSGSKALERALMASLNPLTFEGGAPIGEYFNGFQMHGAKFLPEYEQPFAKRDLSDVVFEHDPRFYDWGLKNYMAEYDTEEDQLVWRPTRYRERYDGHYFVALKAPLVRAARHTKKDMVIKTQIADILHCTWNELEYASLTAMLKMVRRDLKCKEIYLFRDDVTEWICSSYLAKSTGVYANGEALSALVASQEKIEIPLFFIRQQYALWKTHQRLIADSPIDALVLPTSSLDSEWARCQLHQHLGIEIAPLGHEVEWSAINYRSMISNYEWIEKTVAQYFKIDSRRADQIINHPMFFPLTYPIA